MDYGADYVFKLNLNKKEESFIKSSNPKLFIDAVAGKHVNSIASLLTDNSTIINYGLLSGENIQLDPHNTIFKNIILKGFWLSLWLNKMSIEEKNKLYWRVIGRKASGQQTISEIRTFSINPVTGGKQS